MQMRIRGPKGYSYAVVLSIFLLPSILNDQELKNMSEAN
jgi:hypothetical protein